MKVTKEQSSLNKEKILSAASRLYREHGIDGIGIGELAKSAGLTHGSFYRQFPNGKEEFVAAAVSRIFGPVLWWTSLREDKRLARGERHEPPTIIGRRNWVEAISREEPLCEEPLMEAVIPGSR